MVTVDRVVGLPAAVQEHCARMVPARDHALQHLGRMDVELVLFVVGTVIVLLDPPLLVQVIRLIRPWLFHPTLVPCRLLTNVLMASVRCLRWLVPFFHKLQYLARQISLSNVQMVSLAL